MNMAARTIYPLVKVWTSTPEGARMLNLIGGGGDLPNLRFTLQQFTAWLMRGVESPPSSLSIDLDAFGAALAVALLAERQQPTPDLLDGPEVRADRRPDFF